MLAESIADIFDDWVGDQAVQEELTLHEALQRWHEKLNLGAIEITGEDYGLFMRVVVVTLIRWMEDPRRYGYVLRGQKAHITSFSNEADEADRYLAFIDEDRYRYSAHSYRERLAAELARVAGRHPTRWARFADLRESA